MQDHQRTGKPTHDVVVFGFGRSGTTWLAQIIAAAGLELIFEPLKPDQVPLCAGWKPLPLFYRASDDFPWEEDFTRIMNGEIRNEWTIRQNPGARRRVFKFIRANLMAEWILHRYPVRGVFIVRNPLAVVASMIREGWSLPPGWVRGLLKAPRFRDPFFQSLPGVLELSERELSETEARAAFWGIHNLIPRSIGLWSSIPLVIYEEMCRNPEETIRTLAPRLGIPVTDEVLDQCHRRSFMSGTRTGKGHDPTTAWRRELSPEQVREVVGVVERFGLGEFLRDL